MKNEEREITREELYQLVWEKPGTVLAKEFGMTLDLDLLGSKTVTPKRALESWTIAFWCVPQRDLIDKEIASLSLTKMCPPHIGVRNKVNIIP